MLFRYGWLGSVLLILIAFSACSWDDSSETPLDPATYTAADVGEDCPPCRDPNSGEFADISDAIAMIEANEEYPECEKIKDTLNWWSISGEIGVAAYDSAWGVYYPTSNPYHMGLWDDIWPGNVDLELPKTLVHEAAHHHGINHSQYMESLESQCVAW